MYLLIWYSKRDEKSEYESHWKETIERPQKIAGLEYCWLFKREKGQRAIELR